MDAVIRFCFDKDPETLEPEEYYKLYGQGKFILDYMSINQFKAVANAMAAK